jgi:hypothetical protein
LFYRGAQLLVENKKGETPIHLVKAKIDQLRLLRDELEKRDQISVRKVFDWRAVVVSETWRADTIKGAEALDS